MTPSINPADVTCIIPTSDTSDMLNICLLTLKHFVSEITKIKVIGHDSDKETSLIAQKYNVDYVNLDIDKNRGLHFEHLDAINFGIKNTDTKWVLLLHSDMEFVAPFWYKFLNLDPFDMLYAEPVKQNNSLFKSAPKTSFILAKRELFELGISLESRAEDGIVYDIFYDWWKWLEANNKKIILLDESSFYIHYWGYTHYRKNPEYVNNPNFQLYIQILDKIVKQKTEYLDNLGLPFPNKIQEILLNVLKKNESR